MTGVDGVLGGGDLLARLERFATDARVDDAAARRTRERWLRQQADEEATLAGVLLDLAERHVEVALHTRAGRVVHGVVCAVGADFCVVHTTARGGVVVAIAAVATVRTRPGEEAAAGDRPLELALPLTEVLATLAAERERVVIEPRWGGAAVAGELRSLGRDVVTLRLDGERPSTAYVRVAAISELTLAR